MHIGQSDGLGIYFPNDVKVGIATIRIIIDNMNGHDLTRAIVIVRAAMTSSAKKFLNELPDSSVQVQAFEEAELMVNITEHEVLAPRLIFASRTLIDCACCGRAVKPCVLAWSEFKTLSLVCLMHLVRYVPKACTQA